MGYRQIISEATSTGEVIQVREDDDNKNFYIRYIDEYGNKRELDYLKRPIVIKLIKSLARALHTDILIRGKLGTFVKLEDYR
jgi:hypothetical protein